MKEKHSKVKLHATVMTTRLRDSNNQKPAFSKSLKDNTKSGFNTRMSFDARQMIEVCIILLDILQLNVRAAERGGKRGTQDLATFFFLGGGG